MHYDALILDYGQILSYPQQPGPVAAMARLLGVSDETFSHGYWSVRRDYDEGLAVAEYWRRALALMGIHDTNAARLDELIALDIASWTRYRDAMWDVAAEFRAAGGRTAFLSNGVPEIMVRIRADRPLDRWFDVVVVSCEVGLTKPDAAIYTHTLSALGVAAERAFFVDDRAENIAGAAALGLGVLTFSPDRTAADVRAAVGLAG